MQSLRGAFRTKCAYERGLARRKSPRARAHLHRSSGNLRPRGVLAAAKGKICEVERKIRGSKGERRDARTVETEDSNPTVSPLSFALELP